MDNMEQLTEPKMQISLPRLTDGEILGLLGYAKAKLANGQFVAFCGWLQENLKAEIERRSNPLREPEMLSFPGEWTDFDAAESLLAIYCLSKSGITMAQCIFVDELLKNIIADCVARLETK